MNKNCMGCTNMIYIDEKNVQPARKFCSKGCYINFVKRKPQEVEQKKSIFSRFLLSCKSLMFRK